MNRAAMLILIAVLSAGCTFASVKPEMVATAPRDTPKLLIIGDIKVQDELWAPYRLHFVRGVARWIEDKRAFDSVVSQPPATVSERSIVLVGTITEIDKGSAALRWIVGMGAGQAKVKGDFEIQNPRGGVLAKFSARESYLGGAGIGGAGFLDMEDLVRRFAESVAETTMKWARGEKFAASEAGK